MIQNSILPVILCGGKGSRLWPLSRESFPKQFLNFENLGKASSLFQNTVKRTHNIKNAQNPLIICNHEHRFIVAEQMRLIHIQPNSILLEPLSKNTGPAITIAALKSIEKGDDPIIIIMPSDHIINDLENFNNSINSAIKYAKKGNLVTFGVKPTEPVTGYGYIESKNNLNNNYSGEKIIRFIEKPNKKLAEKIFKEKNFLWNSGIFVFKASVFLKEMQNTNPNIYHSCQDCLKNKIIDLDFIRLDESAFQKCENISIDHALMEKTKLGIVLPLNSGWVDAGDWDSIWKISKKDSNGNSTFGDVLLRKVSNSYFRSNKRLVVGMNLRDLIVIDTNDALLIADRKETQNVKEIVQYLESEGKLQAKEHKKVYRPWGSFITIAEGLNWLVKIIKVKPGQSISLQYHNHRTEHWIVLSGKAIVQRDREKIELNKNESIFIPNGTKHRLSNLSESILLTLIEVQCGDYLSEKDIVRLEDLYGRFSQEL